jgi:hypothetical protein
MECFIHLSVCVLRRSLRVGRFGRAILIPSEDVTLEQDSIDAGLAGAVLAMASGGNPRDRLGGRVFPYLSNAMSECDCATGCGMRFGEVARLG